jgi:RES domain-containing protein
MKVYRVSKCRYIDDLSGLGAATFGGRWNNKGTYILYTAATASLALLESVVHISNITVSDYCLVCLNIPDDDIAHLSVNEMPEDWFHNPPPDAIKEIGDQFISDAKYFALALPSAIMPEENNYLINPNHAAAKEIKKVFTRKLLIDDRLVKKPTG